MEFSYPNLGTTFLPPITDEEVRGAVANAIRPYSNCYLAKKAGGLTPDAAKKWKRESSAPGLAPAMNMASSIPSVEWMLRTEIEVRKRGGDPTRFVTELVTDLLRLAEGVDDTAARARAALQQISRLLIKPSSEAPAEIRGPVSAFTEAGVHGGSPYGTAGGGDNTASGSVGRVAR